MALPPALMEAVALSRQGDVEGALKLLLASDAPLDDAHCQSFVYLLLKSRPDLDDALALVNKKLKAAGTDEERCLWQLRRGLLYLDRQDKMRAMVDLNHVARQAANEDHADQARRALGRCLDPDPPADIDALTSPEGASRRAAAGHETGPQSGTAIPGAESASPSRRRFRS